jgi:DNA polymerase-3 subunit gamma/tau
MSYIVLARKWRPQGFGDLIGQETVVTTLKNALSDEKIAHAYLFSGPRGVGKTSAARILAKALNCTNGPSDEPCGECLNCKAITDSSSIDVLEIDGASNTGVDDVRELREAVSGGRYKIYIIDEVHMLSTPAFNALLKTLEEPPPHVIFIFATTEPKKIPSTIQSRCQHHAFRRISKETIKNQLMKVAVSEKIQIRDAALEMVARAADGSMRDALTLLDQASSFSDDIDENGLQILLGLPETGVITDISDTILAGDISKTLSLIKALTERGYDLRSITKELVEHFRNIAIAMVVDDSEEFLELGSGEIQELRGQASGVSIEQLTFLLTELLRLEGEVKTAINPRYTLELGLLRMSFVKGMTSVSDILKAIGEPRVKKPREEQSHKREPITDKQGSTAKLSPQVESIAPSETKDTFRRLIEEISSDDHLLSCKLAEAKVCGVTSDELTIGFNGGMSVLADSIRKNAPLIESTLDRLTGKRLKLKIIALPGKEEKPKSGNAKKKVISEPLVQNVMRMFNGTILEVRSLAKQDDHKG